MDFSKAAAPSEATKAFLARQTHKQFIAGQWVDSASGETFATLDPATGESLGQMARGNAADVDAIATRPDPSFV